MRRGDYGAALAELDLALAISPNLANASGVRGSVLMWSGHPAKGRDALEKSIRLDPRNPNMALRLLDIAVSFYLSGEYDSSLSGEYDSSVEAAQRVCERSEPTFEVTISGPSLVVRASSDGPSHGSGTCYLRHCSDRNLLRPLPKAATVGVVKLAP